MFDGRQRVKFRGGSVLAVWRATLTPEGIVVERRRKPSELYRWRQHRDAQTIRSERYWWVGTHYWSYDVFGSPVSLYVGGGRSRSLSLNHLAIPSAVGFAALCEYLAATPVLQKQLGDRQTVQQLKGSLSPSRLHSAGQVHLENGFGVLEHLRFTSHQVEDGLDRHYPRRFAGHFVAGEEIPLPEEMAEKLRGWKGGLSDEALLRISTKIVGDHQWGFGLAFDQSETDSGDVTLDTAV